VAAQYDLFRLPDGPVVVVIQNDLLDDIRTRVVIPLLPAGSAGKPLKRLNPTMTLNGDVLTLMPQLMATLSLAELGMCIGSCEDDRDVITRAVDTLLAGI